MRKEDFVDTTYESPWNTAQVVATAAGFGLGWANASQEDDAERRSAQPDHSACAEDVPISGRLVDLEGRPVAGATIRHQEILEPDQGDLSAWIAASTAGTGGSYEIEREYLKRKLWPGALGPAHRDHDRRRRTASRSQASDAND